MFLIHYLKILNLVFNKSIESKCAQVLLEKKETLAIAESCTGGLVSSLMTDISGSSSIIRANFVTYANEAKTKYLNVSEDTLSKYGAVSEQTATEMVNGLLNATNSDYALATTGIAGPTGGTKEKPVGLVYIGISNKKTLRVYKYNVTPKYPRILIKYMFAKQALKYLYEFIKETNK